MSETEGQRNDSPLLSERGVTTISDTVVSSLAGMAAQEVDGVHMGGGASRAAGGVLGSITGSESRTSGITVEVGRTETAIDLKMGIEYNKNILQTVEEVRRRITDRVQSMTGLRIKELNATITDITFPEKEERRRIGSRSAPRERDASADETTTAPAQATMPVSEPDPEASERETAQVETRSQAETETTPEEEASVEGRQPVEAETADLPSGDIRTEEQPAGEAPETSEEAETSAETETSEPTETAAEARRRRRAEERARRRRRTEDS